MEHMSELQATDIHGFVSPFAETVWLHNIVHQFKMYHTHSQANLFFGKEFTDTAALWGFKLKKKKVKKSTSTA